MTTSVRYDDSVWKALKKIWEVSPKSTSLETILKQVSESLQCDVPTIATLSRRIKSEKWKKLTAKQLKEIVKNDDENDVKNIENFTNEEIEENKTETDTCDNVFSIEKIKNSEKKIDKISYWEATQKLNKIEELRKQAWNVFNITQSAIDGLAEYIAKLETTDFSQADEQDLKVLTFELSVFEKMVNIANTASMVNERNTKMLIGLHGLDFDDFKDKQAIEQQRTAQLLKLDNLLEEKRLLMAEQQKQAFERNLAAIEDKMRSG